MKKLKVLLSIIVMITLACVIVKKTKKRIVKQQVCYYATSEKPFVVIIPSYNNEEICERNLRSVFDQKYKNYRVIYIDDCSRDGTYKKVYDLVNDLEQQERVTLIKNAQNLGALENLYRAIYSCKDNELVVILDGDDWLAHDWVLEKLNCYYSDPEIWLTYGSYLSYPQYADGECSRPLPAKVFKEISLREYSSKYGMMTSHLRTFYAGLFKKIKLQDFLYKGNFFDSTYDGAMMFPMIEMAGKDHILYIKEPLYIYNRANPLNDDKVNFEKQQRCWRTILSMPRYQELGRLDLRQDDKEISKADLLVFSCDRPLQLYTYLESFYKYVQNYGKLMVLYRTSREEYQKGYEEVMRAFPYVHFCKQGPDFKKDFKPLLLSQVFDKGSADYLLFAVDDIVVKDQIDLNLAIKEMQKRDAYGFYFRLGRHVNYCYMTAIEQGIPFMISLENNVYAWAFAEGRGDWDYPHTLDMTLYKKQTIRGLLHDLEYVNPNTLEANWANTPPLNKVGLCYEQSKIVNIPLGLIHFSTNRSMNLHSAEELLGLFNQGFKIDITPLHQIENRSAHIEYAPLFVERERR